jgi:hypothetical protein
MYHQINYTSENVKHISEKKAKIEIKEFDIHGSLHHNTILIKMTNKMQLCGIIYYSIVPWLLYMF